MTHLDAMLKGINKVDERVIRFDKCANDTYLLTIDGKRKGFVTSEEREDIIWSEWDRIH